MIICSGCSFTIGSHKDENNNDVDYLHWPEFIPDSVNVAVGGAGNRVIARNVLDLLGKERPDAVVVMWSTVERYDYYDPQFNAYKCEGASFTGTKQNYLKYFYSDFNQFAKSLEYILLIQNACTARNIPYVFCHMGDIRYRDWDMDKAYGVDTTSGAKRSISKEMQGNVPSFFDKLQTADEKQYIKSLWEQVSWQNWVFWGETGGLWQMTNDKDYTWIAYHPPEEAHRDWAENIVIPRLKQLRVIKE
jgi:hypothetical protein